MPKASIEYPDEIVTKNNNGGWHRKGKRAYRSAVKTFMQCLQTYKEPRLYQLCFEGKTHKAQMKMLNALIQIADRAGIECEWFACREVADRTKAAHIHAFIIINAHNVNVWSVFNQFDDGQVGQLCIKHGINFSIFPPKDEKGIHNGNTYMALPYQGPGNRQTQLGTERLADALVWLSYAYKARSKPTDEEADGQIFPASRPNRKRSIPLPSAALPAEKEAIAAEAIQNDSKPLQGDSKPSEWIGIKITPEPHQEAVFASQTHNDNKGTNENSTTTQYQTNRQGEACNSSPSEVRCNASLVGSRSCRNASTEASSSPGKASNPRYEDGSGASTHHREGQYEMMWTPAETYVATQYEAAVDQQLDIEAMRLFLLEQGIKRSPAQVAWELEEKYGFYGYASRYPAPAKPDTRALDALIDRTPLKSAKGTHLSQGQDRMIVSSKARKIYQTHC